MDEQIKQAIAKLKEFWAGTAPKRKKLILVSAGIFAMFAVGLVLLLNFSGSQMTVLYEGLASSESVEIYNALLEQGIQARVNSKGEVEVRRSEKDRAIAQMAMQNFPKSTLPYKYFTGGSGLTTTDMERRQMVLQELQDRLQDTIRQYEGVKNVVVTIDLPADTGFPWGGETRKATGSVSLVLQPGYTPSPDQVSGIKYLVSKSVGQGMEPGNVAVIDAATWVNLKSREDTGVSGMDTEKDRLALQTQVEQGLVDKARNVLSLVYAPENIRVSATVSFDYNKVMTESKKYIASEDSLNNTGVLQSQDKNYTMGANSFAQGVAGEEQNTDTTPVYVDKDGDGVPETVDYSVSQEFAVSYVLDQIEKNNAEMVSASLAVMVKGTLTPTTRESILENVSKATNIPENNISVQSVEIEQETTQPALPKTTVLMFIGAAAALLVLLLVVLLMLSSKKKKEQTPPPVPEEPVDMEEELRRHQQELNDHKRQILEAAKEAKKEDAITVEVREFAQTNPEITASLLRAWLKEEEE